MFELVYRLDPTGIESRQMPQSWEEACRLLVQGNRDFAELPDIRRPEIKTRVIPFDPSVLGWGVTEWDHSCFDFGTTDVGQFGEVTIALYEKPTSFFPGLRHLARLNARWIETIDKFKHS